MTDLNFEEDRMTAPSVLEASLADTQLDLLETIWQPCADGLGWPVWDYVARKLFRRAEPILEPGRLLGSLPRVARGIQLDDYGLVWRSEWSPPAPRPDQRVGLTIAGLYALRHRDVRAGALGDAVAEAIGVAAGWERQLQPEVDREVTMNIELANYLPTWVKGTVARYADFLDVLQREWAPVQLRREDSGTASVTLRMYLAPYYRVRDSADYLDIIRQDVVVRPRPVQASPLLIAQMLDYLSLTLKNDRTWTAGPILSKPNLRSAGVIVQPVLNDVDFRDRMSAFAILIETLAVPAPMTADGLDTQLKSLGRLQAWLDARLEDSVARGNARDAVGDLRAAIDLRVEGQHSGSGPQARAARARKRLGLPDVIFDWVDAWDLVRGRIVEALEVICREVRSADDA